MLKVKNQKNNNLEVLILNTSNVPRFVWGNGLMENKTYPGTVQYITTSQKSLSFSVLVNWKQPNLYSFCPWLKQTVLNNFGGQP